MPLTDDQYNVVYKCSGIRARASVASGLKKQLGQALIPGIAILFFIVLFALALFNTGQLASEKIRLSNTADAAVYSGLVWQARALNFHSYTNRAMVANQVTMAQAVSLHSWSLYGRIATENVHAVLGSIPYLGTVSGVMQSTMASIATTIEPISAALLAFANELNGVLSKSRLLCIPLPSPRHRKLFRT